MPHPFRDTASHEKVQREPRGGLDSAKTKGGFPSPEPRRLRPLRGTGQARPQVGSPPGRRRGQVHGRRTSPRGTEVVSCRITIYENLSFWRRFFDGKKNRTTNKQ